MRKIIIALLLLVVATTESQSVGFCGEWIASRTYFGDNGQICTEFYRVCNRVVNGQMTPYIETTTACGGYN